MASLKNHDLNNVVVTSRNPQETCLFQQATDCANLWNRFTFASI